MFGAENVLLSLAKEMRSSKFSSIIGVLRNSQNPHTEIAKEAEKEQIGQVVFSCCGRLDFATIWRIRKFILDYKINIIHTHGYKANFYGLAASIFTRIPLLATCHNWTDANYMLSLYASIDRYFLRYFDRIIIVSEGLRSRLTNSSIRPDRISLIHNGVCLEKFRNINHNSDQKESLNIPPSSPVVGYIGRLSPEKGLPVLLAAARVIIAKCPDIRILIIGDGPLRNELNKICTTLGVTDHVIIAGTKSDIEKIYALIDIFVLPSLNEGLPMVLLEAMASYRPVVATRVGAIPNLIENGINGILVDPGNSDQLVSAIWLLLTDQKERVRIAHSGFDTVSKHFSSTVMSEKYLMVYDKLLNSDVGSGDTLFVKEEKFYD